LIKNSPAWGLGAFVLQPIIGMHKKMKIKKIIVWLLFVYGIVLIIASFSLINSLPLRETYSRACLNANSFVLRNFYATYNRTPKTLSELELYCKKQHAINMQYHHSRDGILVDSDFFSKTYSFTGFCDVVRVPSGFLDLIFELETPLIYDFKSTNYLHDRNWIIAAFYMPFATRQFAITYGADGEGFMVKKLPINEFKQSLKKQKLILPNLKIDIMIINLVVFLSPIIIVIFFSVIKKFFDK